jgi:hypothetical protein
MFFETGTQMGNILKQKAKKNVLASCIVQLLNNKDVYDP